MRIVSLSAVLFATAIALRSAADETGIIHADVVSNYNEDVVAALVEAGALKTHRRNYKATNVQIEQAISLNALQAATLDAIRTQAKRGVVGADVLATYKQNVVKALLRAGALIEQDGVTTVSSIGIEIRPEHVMRPSTIAKREAFAALPRNPVGRPKGTTKAVLQARAQEAQPEQVGA